MIRLFLCTFLLASSGLLNAQSVLFNTSGGSPDPSAILELESSTQGFLCPRMNDGQRLGIGSPAQGLLVFQTNGLIGFYYYNGASWDTLGGSTNISNFNSVTNIANSGIVVLRDEKPNGVDGGSIATDVWQTRELNTIDGDSSFVSLNANAFTLDSGVYVISVSVPSYRISEHQSRLFNNTTTAVAAVGTVEFPPNFSTSTSFITVVIEVNNASGEEFVVQHRTSAGRLNNGLGIGSSWTDNVYTQVKIEKL